MLYCHRIKQVDSDQADEDIESAFGLQLEQLILQGKSELDLIPMMAGKHLANSLDDRLAVQLAPDCLLACRVETMGGTRRA